MIYMVGVITSYYSFKYAFLYESNITWSWRDIFVGVFMSFMLSWVNVFISLFVFLVIYVEKKNKIKPPK